MTAPLVPAEVDLRNFKFMPLDVDRLRRSKQWLVARRKPEIGFYALNLWLASWHERPAGSLEDEDEVLADLAMCQPRHWPKVKADVMRGWKKCDDGRLYHPVVCEKALEAWEAKLDQRERTNAARLGRLRKRLAEATAPEERARLRAMIEDLSQGDDRRTTENETESVTDNATGSKGQGQGQGQGIEEEEERARDSDPGNAVIAAFDRARVAVFGASRARPYPWAKDRPTAQRWLEAGADLALCESTFLARFQQQLASGDQPSDSLAHMDRSIAGAIAARSKPMPAAGAAAPGRGQGFAEVFERIGKEDRDGSDDPQHP